MMVKDEGKRASIIQAEKSLAKSSNYHYSFACHLDKFIHSKLLKFPVTSIIEKALVMVDDGALVTDEIQRDPRKPYLSSISFASRIALSNLSN